MSTPIPTGATPGPWRVVDFGNVDEYEIVSDAPELVERHAEEFRRKVVSCGEPGDYGVGLNLADANLIAAAPCLYAALNEVSDMLTWPEPNTPRLRGLVENALAKARGEM